MKTLFTLTRRISALCCAFLVVSAAAQAQIGMGPRQNSYTQNFDELPATGKATWKNGQEYLPGLAVYRSKNDTIITANTGQANTGGLYSYGATGSTDRALGSLASTNAGQFTYNMLFQNNTGNTIKSVEVKYTGEQWRISNATAPQHELSFWYAITSDPASVSTIPTNNKGWTEVPELKFYGPKFYLTGGPLNGNAAENKALLQHMLQIEVPAGYYLMLRWKDADEIEADHGLAVDDVTITWYAQTVEAPAPLPVELAHFGASIKGAQVELQWQTASEDQNSHFVVERSPDGKSFEGIGLVKGNGTTALTTNYTFVDQVPLAGISYYRLKQVDEDETYTYSKVIYLTRKVAQEIKVYPTITTNELQVTSDRQLRQMFVVDAMGRKLLEKNLHKPALQHAIDVSRLESGTYVLVLLDEQSKRHTSRFVKR
ncbi:T9SS C-terminal target domain-containing protein [Pontibacter anaerobius]|uniref:T9SS C-terminal target domain-containing protein n=1 Tax=Pontibacter anaerobius TaxID=2993940 RepID=A0ABT3REY5_9BACT|nr:T9SS C-terminal target domain-containing protein [Pontibacter anaerobius]MCX2740127.1 T9SS C-terminal target domain-containing protein [Pontibacter anaerobius]